MITPFQIGNLSVLFFTQLIWKDLEFCEHCAHNVGSINWPLASLFVWPRGLGFLSQLKVYILLQRYLILCNGLNFVFCLKYSKYLDQYFLFNFGINETSFLLHSIDILLPKIVRLNLLQFVSLSVSLSLLTRSAFPIELQADRLKEDQF